jgi:uncharacterized protein with PQ loop repeat
MNENRFSYLAKQLLTGRDNETYDLGRVSWVICLIAVIGFSIYQILHTEFSLREFGETIGAVVGVHSAGIWAKRDTEPQAFNDTQKPLANDDISK